MPSRGLSSARARGPRTAPARRSRADVAASRRRAPATRSAPGRARTGSLGDERLAGIEAEGAPSTRTLCARRLTASLDAAARRRARSQRNRGAVEVAAELAQHAPEVAASKPRRPPVVVDGRLGLGASVTRQRRRARTSRTAASRSARARLVRCQRRADRAGERRAGTGARTAARPLKPIDRRPRSATAAARAFGVDRRATARRAPEGALAGEQRGCSGRISSVERTSPCAVRTAPKAGAGGSTCAGAQAASDEACEAQVVPGGPRVARARAGCGQARRSEVVGRAFIVRLPVRLASGRDGPSGWSCRAASGSAR